MMTSVCYSLRDLLLEEGCEVEVATNGLDALKVLGRRAGGYRIE